MGKKKVINIRRAKKKVHVRNLYILYKKALKKDDERGAFAVVFSCNIYHINMYRGHAAG